MCEFSSHPDYVTMGLPLRKTGLSQQQKHESDLANLHASVTSISTTTTTTTTTTATTSVSASSPTTTESTTTTQMKPKMGKVQGIYPQKSPVHARLKLVVKRLASLLNKMVNIILRLTTDVHVYNLICFL